MTPENFCYWLQGFFEINGAKSIENWNKSLSCEQVNEIKNHLDLVFNKVTPTSENNICELDQASFLLADCTNDEEEVKIISRKYC